MLREARRRSGGARAIRLLERATRSVYLESFVPETTRRDGPRLVRSPATSLLPLVAEEPPQAHRCASATRERVRRRPVERERLEAVEGTPRGDGVLCAARRREEALRIANGDCRAEIFKQLMRGARTKGD